MEETLRHKKIYRALYNVVKWPVKAIFGYSCADDKLEEPTLVVSNHATDVDFFFVSLGLNGSHLYYVASEHIFRLGWVSKVINWLVAPIARRKGTTAMDTAMTMMRKLRAGHSVCVFGEGESTWNGRSIPVYPATATLARVSGKPMKTFRIEGGHLTMPRWGKGLRRGKVYGHVVNTYTPEQLKKMTVEEINEAINRDLYEDAWERQKAQPVRYRYGRRAESIETALFLCPKCKKIGTLRGKRNHILCDCGLKVEINEYGTFEPETPFENIAQWDEWQMECLRNNDFASDTCMLDSNMTLFEVSEDHGKKEIAKGDFWLEGSELCIGDNRFELGSITNLALIQKKLIVFTFNDQYYEIRADRPKCLRKYYASWCNHTAQNTKGA